MALRRVFVANRGEIAVRIVRACRALGLETVVGVSAADTESLAAEMADRRVVLGPAQSRLSYLAPKLVVHAAKSSGCDALHPGYGFLSERGELARLCEEEQIAFVGPRAETIEALGDKLAARRIAAEVDVPLVPGTDQIHSAGEAKKAAETIGYPVILKASAGGGGRGVFVAEGPAEIESSFDRASNEAKEAFGDGSLYMERYVANARHVEVQVLGDGRGKVVHLGERDCSAQRRYQKVIEEAPCQVMPETVRQLLYDNALRLVGHLKYRNAGTVEFLYDMDREEIYFIEVNARIQVEHPVTEAVTGVDLVQWQLRLAGGEALDLDQESILPRGHAIECRINAEDPYRSFAPCPGRITEWRPPEGEGLRLDTHCREGYLVPPFYDSMIAKLIAYGTDRDQAIQRMQAALDTFGIGGIGTNIAFQRYLTGHADFTENAINTRWLEREVLPVIERKGV